ncbi:MAG: HSP18 transcriptional regulator [Pseudonocardiaceae bacterium]
MRLIQAVLAGVGGDTRIAQSAGPAEVLAALVILRRLREDIADWEPRLITAARDQGVSWASLAPALGVTSRQAAERRYLRLRPSAGGESTGEQRVQAERTRRAGDRAVAQWARRNSAALRQLAGQVSALQDLTTSARHQTDRVQRALADNDPTALLAPLVAAHIHVRTSHVGLAEQINAVAEHVEQLRRDTRARRRRTSDEHLGQTGNSGGPHS